MTAIFQYGAGWLRLVVCLLFLAILSGITGDRTDAFAENAPGKDAPQTKIVHEEWAEDADIAIVLDQHMYPALLKKINEFADQHKINIAVREGTCGVSAGALAAQTADMTGFCCPPSEADRSLGVVFHTIAIGPIAMYVHPDNPINDLTLEEARGVFSGDISRWSELKTADGKPGPPYPIEPVGRLHCKTRPGHWRTLLDNEDLFSPRLTTVGSIEDVFRQVEANPYSIGGFESLYMAREVYPAQKPLISVKINGFAPTPDNLLAAKYPLYFVFNLSTWKKSALPQSLLDDLIQYLRQQVEHVDPKFGMVSANTLKQAGWQFSGDEVVNPPSR